MFKIGNVGRLQLLFENWRNMECLRASSTSALSVLVAGVFFVSQVVFPSVAFMEASSSDYEGKDASDAIRKEVKEGESVGVEHLLERASDEDIQLLKKYYTSNMANSFLPMNLLSKNYPLTVYEALILSDAIKKDAIKKARTPQERTIATGELVSFQQKYEDAYKEIFDREPNNKVSGQSQQEIPKPNEGQDLSFSPQAQSSGGVGAQNISGISPADYASMPDILGGDAPYQKNMSPSYSTSAGYGNGGGYGSPSSTGVYQDQINDASIPTTPEEFTDSMSLVKIRNTPSKNEGMPSGSDDNLEPDPENPAKEFSEQEGLGKISPSRNTSSNSINFLEDESKIDNAENCSLKELISAEAESTIKEAKKFFVTVYHQLYYVDEHGEGNIPLDTNYRDDTGNYYQPVVTNQYQLEETLGFGLGFRIHKALDMILGIEITNEKGSIFSSGAKWGFSNVMFDFHPERLVSYDKLHPGKIKLDAIKELDDNGIVIRDGGRFVGKRLGHSTVIGTDTQTGESAIQIKDGTTQLSYSQAKGATLSSYKGRYYIGFGKVSLGLSSYTLQMTDVKAIQAGYRDRDQSLLFIYAKPKSKREGYISNNESVAGQYNRYIKAFQYTNKKLFKFMDVAFNFAQSKDSGSLSNPNGAMPSKTTVYSLVVQSKNMNNTSFQGEFAHSKNDYNINSNSDDYKTTGNADYFDITHRFSDKLSGTLHLINIDGTYDASSLVEDRTGDYLLTTNQGDGTPDYIYKPGQRGLEFGLSYNFGNNASLAFGWERYTTTTTLDENGNPVSKSGLFLSGAKGWEIKNSDGDTVGEIQLQQRFERNKNSTRTVAENISDTTISYDGSPWKGGQVQSTYQREINNYDGNTSRFDLEVAHPFYPLKRVTVTPRMQYSKKKGASGISETSSEINTTTLINSLTIGYELIPDELTINLLLSKEKYNVLASEIDKSTGAKVDGEKRDIFGKGIGLAWEPKKIPGLSMGVSFRKDKVHYYTPEDRISNQDVWEYTISYERALSDKIRASVSYDYRNARDKIQPLYDEVTRTVSIDFNANIAEDQIITLRHEYEKEYKPLDQASNHATRTTVLQMTNRF